MQSVTRHWVNLNHRKELKFSLKGGNEVTMTNAALQAFIAEFGNKIFVIVLDNNHKVFIGSPLQTYDNKLTTTIDQLKFKTYGDVDMFGISRVDHTWEGRDVPFTNWMVTACIQSIAVTDGDDLTYLPDLNKWF